MLSVSLFLFDSVPLSALSAPVHMTDCELVHSSSIQDVFPLMRKDFVYCAVLLAFMLHASWLI